MTERTDKTLKALTLIYMADSMPKPDGEDPIHEIMEQSYTGRILKTKMEAVQCPFDITDSVYIVLDICSNNSPGLAQILLHDLLYHAHNRGYTKIGIEEFSLIHPMNFPIVMDDYDEYTEFGKTICEEWDAQKSYTDDGHPYNKVDTAEYWNEVFRGIK